MNILLTGGTGFIGNIIYQSLINQGHSVVRAVRSPKINTDIAVNFEHDTRPDIWLPRLDNIEAIINAVGIMGGTTTTMMDVHCHTPAALAQAAAQKNIQRFIQISSLGVDSGVDTLYFRSKLAGEQAIRSALPQSAIIRPSMVFGIEGSGTQLFMQLTRLPIIMLPYAGNINVQPVHGSDIGAAVIALLKQSINNTDQAAYTVDAVGVNTVTMTAYLNSLATQLNRTFPLRLIRVLPMPLYIAKTSAKLASLLPQHIWTPDTLSMLCAGSTADVTPFNRLLGRLPIALHAFVAQPSVINPA